MKKIVMVLLMTMGVVACRAVSREVNAIRADAVETLCRVLPDTFVSRNVLADAMQFIEKELDPAVHQKLLELQDEADKLNAIKMQMLAIPNVTTDSPAIQSIDTMLNDIAKKFNDLLYNGGFFNWRTLLSAGIGFNTGLYCGFNYKKEGVTAVGKAWHGVVVGFVAAMLLEFSLRGRKALIAGSVFNVMAMVAEVMYKFFSALFGKSGTGDRWLSTLEVQMRSWGAQLDKIFNNKWGAFGITGVAMLVAGLIITKRQRNLRQQHVA
ncbi:MAG: hypothetical protein QG632_731 [Candidatus Dependentiae bacterium]|nr:hypothetical protein [Candidatus Dependentiae bacterium]